MRVRRLDPSTTSLHVAGPNSLHPQAVCDNDRDVQQLQQFCRFCNGKPEKCGLEWEGAEHVPSYCTLFVEMVPYYWTTDQGLQPRELSAEEGACPSGIPGRSRLARDRLRLFPHSPVDILAASHSRQPSTTPTLSTSFAAAARAQQPDAWEDYLDVEQSPDRTNPRAAL